MKLILHIGMEKTGTTSLQKLLASDLTRSIPANMHYLADNDGMNARALASNFSTRIDEEFMRKKKISPHQYDLIMLNCISEIEKRIKNIEKKGNIDTIIISSEHFHSLLLSKNSVEKFLNWARRHFSSIEIVIYLRKQNSLVRSLYSTALREGYFVDEAEFFFHSSKNYDYLSFDSLIKRWSFNFVKLRVYCYDREMREHGSISSSFFKKILNSENIIKRDITENRALTKIQIRLFHKINYLFPKFVNGKYIDGRHWPGDFLRRIAGMISLGARHSDTRAYESFFRDYEHENDAVRDEYFPNC